GLSFFSPQKGFGCDNVLNYQIFLVNGSIVNVNATLNPHLFRALKGRSNNFGVVAEFDIEIFSQGVFWGGAIEYPQATDVEQLEALVTFTRFDPYAEIELSFSIRARQHSKSPRTCFISKLIVSASALKPFPRIHPQLINTMRISYASDFAQEIVGFQPSNY
ncbi:hypothetical protein MMC14_009805, partial [Varicellaria rhodocarpa]|nr:hypothetical protein [Varicellaria rhodocarpa]